MTWYATDGTKGSAAPPPVLTVGQIRYTLDHAPQGAFNVNIAPLGAPLILDNYDYVSACWVVEFDLIPGVAPYWINGTCDMRLNGVLLCTIAAEHTYTLRPGTDLGKPMLGSGFFPLAMAGNLAAIQYTGNWASSIAGNGNIWFWLVFMRKGT